MKNLKYIPVFLLFWLLIINLTQAQTVGINYINITFETQPTYYTVEVTPLRYNKDFALGMHIVGGKKDIFSHALPVLNGGTVEGTYFPGCYYTDGCGGIIPFKMSSAFYAFENGTEDGHDPNGPYATENITWPELTTLYQMGWGLYNNGLTNPASNQYYYQIERNNSFTKRQMQGAVSGGPEFTVMSNPNNNNSFTPVAFGQDYITAFGNYTFGVPSFNVTQTTLGDNQEMGRTRLLSGVNLSAMVNLMNSQSVNGAHRFGSAYTTSITGEGNGYAFFEFAGHMQYINDVYGKDSLDNIWMTTEEEIMQYLMVAEKVQVNSVQTYKYLTITFDELYPLPIDFRHYALTLWVETDAVIESINISPSGTSSSYCIKGDTSVLINLSWDGYIVIPDTANAETFVNIAENTHQQTDWNIAMDYVEIIPPGATKEYFRDRLCAIPGIIPPEGYCFCTTTAGPDTTICIGECTQLIAGEGVSYLWNTGATTRSINVCPASTTTYSVRVYNEIGCPSYDSATVTIAPLPNASAGNDTSICLGTCATLKAAGGVKYLWNTGDTTQTIVVCPSSRTTYTVLVTSEFNCEASDNVTVNVLPVPNANAGNDVSVCRGECATLTATGGVSYIWSTGETSQSVVVCPTDTTRYYVTAIGANGCTDTDSVDVFVKPTPNANAGNDTLICKGDCAVLTATGGTSYLWSTGGQTQSIEVCPGDTTMYYVLVNNQFNCPVLDSVKVGVLPVPLPVINNGNDTAICAGNCIDLTVTTGTSYLWNTGQTTQTINVCPLTSTTYKVEVFNEYNCSAFDSILVTVHELPNANAGNDTSVCFGNCITLTASGGTMYIWDTGDTAQSVEVCPQIETYYRVTVFNEYGCSKTDSVKVSVNPLPVPETGNDTTICNGTCATLTASGGTQYLWSNGDTTQSTSVCPDLTTLYYVWVYNNFGCFAKDSVTVNVISSPSANAGNDTTICQEGCAVLNASGGDTYLWNTGETTPTITVCPPDSTLYFVTAFITNGCYDTDSVMVHVNPLPVAYVSNDTTICNNSEIELTASGGIRYLWSTGDTTATIKVHPVVTTKYFVDIFNSFNCFVKDSVTVLTIPAPIATINSGSDTIICKNDCIELSVPVSTGVFWSTGETNQTITVCPNITTMYSVQILGENGCIGKDTIIVYVNQLPNAYAGPDTAICRGGCATLEASGGTRYLWDTGDTTFWKITCPLSDSMYYVTVFDDFGCYARDSVEVFVDSIPDITITSDTGVCQEGCITLQATGGINYFWSTGEDTSDIYVCPETATTYYVEVQNSYQCSATDSVVVIIYPDPQPGLPNDTTVCQYNCIYLVAHQGSEYLWNTGQTSDSILICPEEPSRYYVDVTSIFGCKGSDTTDIEIIPGTEAFIYDLLPVFCTYEDSVLLHAYPAGGEFSGEGVTLAGTNYYFDPAKVDTGQHHIVYAFTNEFDCIYLDTANITILPQPFVDLGGDTTVCNNDLLTLSAPSGFDNYLWSTGDRDPITRFYPGDLGQGLQIVELIVTKNGCAYIAEKPLTVIICNPGINEYGNAPDIIVYPVPASEHIFIEIDQYYQPIGYQITDIFGKIQDEGVLTNCAGNKCKNEILIPRLTDGMYMIILTGPDFISIEKFMVQKY